MTIRAFLKTKLAEKKSKLPKEQLNGPLSVPHPGPASTQPPTTLEATNPTEKQDNLLPGNTSSKRTPKSDAENHTLAEAQIDIPRQSVEVGLHSSNDWQTHANLATRMA
jgi:hypothetical protein